MDTFRWDGMDMPKHPIDRQQRDTARLWPALQGTGNTPAQAPYVGCRSRRADTTRSWADLNRVPAGVSTRPI